MYVINLGTVKEQTFADDRPLPLLINKKMTHEHGGGSDPSPQQTPSPPHAPRLPMPDSSFHRQIMQNQSPRKNHIAERAKQTLENSFLIQLKKQQQLQQEILLQHFEQQRQQLAEQHEQQLRQHLKLWEQQKAMEEAAMREAREAREVRERERDRLELRKKDKHEHSANASTQVKQKLQEFLKKKAAANANGTVPGSPYRNWGIVKSSSGESITSPGATCAHPYRPLPLTLATAPPQPSPADYPLRKTDCDGVVVGGEGHPVPIREEEEPAQPPELLFSSPSLPNISLGRAPPQSPSVCVNLAPVCETDAGGAVCVPGGAAGCARGARPLGRTHSAPLPLGDAALQSHHHAREHIRHTVLTRAHEAAVAKLQEEEGEVIDLTSKRVPPPSPPGVPPAPPPAPPAVALPLARALSSPLVGARQPTTGLAYDPLMLKHGCVCGAHAPTHPEHSGRLQSIWARLCETGLAARTERTRPRKASLPELQLVHTEAHVAAWGGRGCGAAPRMQLVRLACGGVGVDADTAFSEHHSPQAARLAAGAVLDLALRTAAGDLNNGFAVVRPPGHHAEAGQAMGFCFFNSVAVAAKVLQTRLRLQRILIVDWDVHHGNGTQQVFYEDPGVLYMSIHRHDDGNFFPGTGAATECGAGAGLGYSVNVAWSTHLDPPLADAEYLAAFRTVIMPIAKEYDPEIVLVSCGFDAAGGHPAPLGGYRVSPACFAHMTRDLMSLANGKVVLALEGGYDLTALCDCAAACVRALLGERLSAPPLGELARSPAPPAQRALLAAHRAHAHHWPVLKQYTETVGMSALEASPPVGARTARATAQRDLDTAAAMASLSMQPRAAHHTSPDSSRSVSEEPMEQDEAK